jgi:hypothetical protein
VQRVLVAGKAIDQRLLRQRRHFDDAFRVAFRRLVARLGPGLAAEAALAAQKEREAVGEQARAGFAAGLHLDHDERSLPLVPDLLHGSLAVDLRLRRNRLVDLEVLLAVEQHGEVEVHPRRSAEVAHGPEHGNDAEAREHLEILLVGVFELARVRRGNARTDSQVVEDHIVLLPFARSPAQFGAEGLRRIDRHVAPLFLHDLHELHDRHGLVGGAA